MSQNIVNRTYGWIQNPSDFNKLKKTVQIFDVKSDHYKLLRDHWIQSKINYFPDLKDSLLDKFNRGIAIFTYEELVGSSKNKYNQSPKTRSDAVANALIQISLLPQNYKTTGKDFIDNWSADGFLRWAVSLNFIKTDRINDTFCITSKGIEFSKTKDDSTEQNELLIKAFLSYPPATRILEILSDNNPRNKFYLGHRLGFVGEKGFTSYSESIMLDYLLSEDDPIISKKIRQDVEGTNDKYARMICGWLSKVDLIESIGNTFDGKTTFRTYKIKGKGLHLYNQSKGSSKNKKQPKFLMWEFLATDISDRNYVRTRRAWIIKILTSKRTAISFSMLENELKSTYGFDDELEIIKADVNGLINFGLRIDINENTLRLLDEIKPFDIPQLNVTEQLRNIKKDKEKASFLKHTQLDAKYISLLDITFDRNSSRDFEMLVAEIFEECYQLKAVHLGGGLKPDGIAFTDAFGLIIDTKAYADGYGKNISEADKMIRYIKDNIERNPVRNQTEWWKEFSQKIPKQSFFFLWVSGVFKSNFNEQLDYVYLDTGYKGASINAKQFLLGADAVLKGHLQKNEIPEYFNNKEIMFVSN